MDSYLAGTSVTIAIPLTDLAGNALVPVSMSYTVSDESGVQVIASTALTPPGDMEVEITIPASGNMLPTGKTLVGRVVNLQVVTASGTVPLEYAYMVRATSLLIPLVNSFQSWSQAMLNMSVMPRLAYFGSASRDEQEGALIEAFDRLRRLTYVITEEFEAMKQITWPGETETWRILFDDWTEMTTQEFTSYPQTFRTALFKAQIAEADDILGGTSPADRRRLGIQSETIGESSMFFRPSKPIDYGCSPDAHRYLKRYIVRSVKMGRA